MQTLQNLRSTELQNWSLIISTVRTIMMQSTGSGSFQVTQTRDTYWETSKIDSEPGSSHILTREYKFDLSGVPETFSSVKIRIKSLFTSFSPVLLEGSRIWLTFPSIPPPSVGVSVLRLTTTLRVLTHSSLFPTGRSWLHAPIARVGKMARPPHQGRRRRRVKSARKIQKLPEIQLTWDLPGDRR